jgi:hypothetical protein
MATVPRTRAGRREWIGLALIALPCMLYSIMRELLNVNPVRSTPREQRRHVAGMHHSRDTGGG